jgi:DNA-binding transcriptional LysR family regulator
VSLSHTVVDLVAEGYDLAIRLAETLADSALVTRRLGQITAALYASPSYLARRGRPRSLGDERHDWVLPRGASRISSLRDLRCRFVCDDLFLLRDLLREGTGVGLLTSLVAEPYVRDGLLERIDLGGLEYGLTGTLFLVYPTSGQVPRKVTAFRDFLLEELERSSLG